MSYKFNPFTGRLDRVLAQNLSGYVPYSGTADDKKIYLGSGDDAYMVYTGTQFKIVLDDVAASDLIVDCGTEKTIELAEPVWDDMLINSGIFKFAGTADPTLQNWQPGGSGRIFKVYKFKVNDIIYFSCQLPHSYSEGFDIECHVHWSPCDRGTTEGVVNVGWKVDYSWASIDAAFPSSSTVIMTGTCSNHNDWHELAEGTSTVDGTGQGISSMIQGALYRSDTGDDDTWAGTTNATSPALLQFDFHIRKNTHGSRAEWTK